MLLAWNPGRQLADPLATQPAEPIGLERNRVLRIPHLAVTGAAEGRSQPSDRAHVDRGLDRLVGEVVQDEEARILAVVAQRDNACLRPLPLWGRRSCTGFAVGGPRWDEPVG
jgi:hypothetical protein